MKKILLATSDSSAKSIKEFLEKKGYKIIEACDNQQAIKIATCEIPDIILVDFLSNKINGLEFCEKLRENLH